MAQITIDIPDDLEYSTLKTSVDSVIPVQTGIQTGWAHSPLYWIPGRALRDLPGMTMG